LTAWRRCPPELDNHRKPQRIRHFDRPDATVCDAHHAGLRIDALNRTGQLIFIRSANALNLR
jgi:hypothetical protein